MTSQVILFNGYGVAIASDSAMTMAGNRVYDTAEKVIQLDEPSQFAVLWSGSTHLHGYPYSLLINEWKRSIKGTRLPNAVQYAESFIKWVSESALFDQFQQAVQFSRLVDGLFEWVWTDIDDLRLSKHQSGEDVSISDCEAVIQGRVAELMKWPQLFGASSGEWYHQLCQEIDGWISERINFWFDDVPWSTGLEASLRNCLEIYILRSCINSDQRATLAFVGYGTNEVMPSFFRLEIRGFFGNSVLWRFDGREQFDPSEGNAYVGVKLLAQHEAISTFIGGIDDQIYARLRSEMLSGTEENAIGSDEASADSRVTRVESILGHNERMQRFNNVVAFLPLGSLVAVAEALIGIQSLSQAVNGELNTVGGPIDTAVITRQKGFHWVRSKTKYSRDT